MLTKEELALEIITSRYRRPISLKLEEYFNMFGVGEESINFLLDKLEEKLNNPLGWDGYKIPDQLKCHADFFKNHSQNILYKYKKLSLYNKDSVIIFFNDNHIFFKYAIQKWLIVNAGICFELYNIDKEKFQINLLDELLKKGLRLNDQVLHLHVISNIERKNLIGMGFPVPFEHWDRSYYLEALYLANQILQTNKSSIGLFCKDSWVFDPAIHEIASDGKPYASFNFLKDDIFVGERFFVSNVRPDNAYSKQFDFALRSPRRLKFYQTGEYNPTTYGIFYAKDQLNNNILSNKLSKDC